MTTTGDGARALFELTHPAGLGPCRGAERSQPDEYFGGQKMFELWAKSPMSPQGLLRHWLPRRRRSSATICKQIPSGEKSTEDGMREAARRCRRSSPRAESATAWPWPNRLGRRGERRGQPDAGVAALPPQLRAHLCRSTSSSSRSGSYRSSSPWASASTTGGARRRALCRPDELPGAAARPVLLYGAAEHGLRLARIHPADDSAWCSVFAVILNSQRLRFRGFFRTSISCPSPPPRHHRAHLQPPPFSSTFGLVNRVLSRLASPPSTGSPTPPG